MRMISLFHTLVFMVTVLTFSMPFVTLAQQNALQAKAIVDAEKDAAINVDTTRWFWRGCFGGVSALTQVYEPSLPASRLLGKSPEYTAYYTDAYKAKATELQSSAVKKGCTTAGAVYLGLGIILIASFDDIGSSLFSNSSSSPGCNSSGSSSCIGF